jgi:hypothetical protein
MLKAEEQKRISAAHRTTGKAPLEMIAAERQAQLAMGYDAKHDDGHSSGELAAVAACFALGSTEIRSGEETGEPRNLWPAEWSPEILAENTRMRQLVVAGALIAAEIERLQRAHFAAIDTAQQTTLETLEF